MTKRPLRQDGSHYNSRPNLLNFANNVLLSKNRMGAYNLNTMEQSPDTGYFVIQKREVAYNLDNDTLRQFWKSNAPQLANGWLIVFDNNGFKSPIWYYCIGELVQVLTLDITNKSQIIIDNSTGELIKFKA